MYYMIEISFDNINGAKAAANVLLDKMLVSSCQIIESNSIWSWKGTRQEGKEYLLLVKTKQYLVNDVYNEVKQIQEYEIFEFAMFELKSINEDYIKWINEETK